MSNAYKCDNCKALYENRTSLNIFRESSKEWIDYYLGNRNDYADICPDCISAMQKALDDRKAGVASVTGKPESVKKDNPNYGE